MPYANTDVCNSPMIRFSYLCRTCLSLDAEDAVQIMFVRHSILQLSLHTRPLSTISLGRVPPQYTSLSLTHTLSLSLVCLSFCQPLASSACLALSRSLSPDAWPYSTHASFAPSGGHATSALHKQSALRDKREGIARTLRQHSS